MIDLYDTSLKHILNENNMSLPKPYVIKAGAKLLQILEQIHNRSVIHRDIKPHNIGVNYGFPHKDDSFSIFDFGISKLYVKDNNIHIPFVDNKGNVSLISLNALKISILVILYTCI